MEYKEISASTIAKVDRYGIYFANGDSLLFEQCLAARQKIYPSSKSVADRDIIADPPYFEFYAVEGEIPIRIVFDKKELFDREL